MKSNKSIITLIFILLCSFSQIVCAGKRFTIVHSNDLHSHLMSFSPSMDFTYEKDDDKTIGGVARIATVIKNIRSERKNPVAVVDAGDFTMGTMFHTLAQKRAFELNLLNRIGYDVLTLGNHEFDMKPRGIANILRAAEKGKFLHEIVASNIIFSSVNAGDDSLYEAYQDKLIKEYTVKKYSGLKVGFFGLLGKDAAFKSPYASPLRFGDQVKTAKKVVKKLREKEGVDIVVCLSHSGLFRKGRFSEDEKLANEVSGIDIIVSGHSHTATKKPVKIKNTIIVQTGYHGTAIGVLDVEKEDKFKVNSYKLVKIDDSIQSDLSVLRVISDFRDEIDEKFFSKHGYKSRDVIGETDFDLVKKAEDCSLGNLLSDSVKWYVNKHSYNKDNPESKVMVSIVAHGMMRDSIYKGKTGRLSAGELFKVLPLGIGKDGSMGYPLVSFYIYPHELKKGLEIITSLRPIMGNSLFLHVSGVKIKYNPNRMIFDKIFKIWTGSRKNGYTRLNYSKSNSKLIRVAANYYVAGFLKKVGGKTFDILKIVPKDKNGIPVRDLAQMIVDADKNRKGVQELKEWKAPLKFISSFKDKNGNKIPDLPDQYRKKRDYITVEKSINPLSLVKNGTIITWVGFLLVLTVFFVTVFLAGFILNRIYPDRFIRSKG